MNDQHNRLTFLISLMTRLYWKIRIFFLALRWVHQINLGDLVWYKNEKYYVLNGNRANSWRLSGLDDGKNTYNTGWVSSDECKKVLSFKNAKHSFFAGWNFYTTSWFEIWCREGIKGWMRGCNIWPWPFNR